MSWAAPMPMPGRSSSSERAWSVSSSWRATTTGSALGSRASARRRDGGNEVAAGQPLADERELEQLLGAGVHQPGSVSGDRRVMARGRPDTDRWPATAKRHGRAAQSSPA